MKKEQLEKIGAGTAKRSSSSFFLKNKLKHEQNFAQSCNGQCEIDIRSQISFYRLIYVTCIESLLFCAFYFATILGKLLIGS